MCQVISTVSIGGFLLENRQFLPPTHRPAAAFRLTADLPRPQESEPETARRVAFADGAGLATAIAKL
jgi:hypothetical protein